MKPFAIDIDDVLADLSTAMYPSLKLRYPSVRPVEHWSIFNLSKLFSIPYEGFLQAIVEDKLLENAQPLPGACRAMEQIHQSGHPIVLITSRGFHFDALRVTQEWLARHRIPYDDLIIVPHGMTKAQAAIGKYPKGFLYMIDDSFENLDAMKNAGLVRYPILINQPWNASRKDYAMGGSRFSSLMSFVNNLKKEAFRYERQPFCRDMSMAI
jgi:uncharacterized HAD superfamily protein